ncbi:ubiquitin-conjugating enzyme E2 38 isoform X1 [Canna indica]|uniref:E2 ubiquitin-conjugating enzyme n=1 Tax=Canna indica TaxID=4628 RepID=A0AAQ3JTE5_9LILI|nr:ubiquitin-conjugating enzyme E2 38 isoform X1 [Canna indica]
MEPSAQPPHPPLFIAPELDFYVGSSSSQDPDIMEISQSSAAAWASGQPKRKRSQVVPHDVIELDGDDDPDGVVIIGESTSDYKNKQPIRYDKSWQKQIKDAFSNDLVASSANLDSEHFNPPDTSKSYESGPLDLNYYDDAEYDYAIDDDDFDDYGYHDEIMENDFNFNLAAKFDDLDLPTGIEATVPWLNNTTAKEPIINKKKLAIIDDEIDLKYKLFKQFDTVRDHSDHYFGKPEILKTATVKKPSKDWSKRIQHEWKVLENDLPETIYVRIYEDRMDILRAVIIGPAGTPYHDGLFFFDVFFPPHYPQVPPMVHYQSGGLRLNPNLYACGKVCLSLLNTWSGSGCEKWNPSNSTMLQVLVSIQALVLNAKPYFNEPGYAQTANTPYGEKKSLAYNESTFLLSCKTMLYSLRRPPMHFEDFVAGHFRHRGRTILVACKAYMDGAQVGCVVGEGVQDVDEGDKSCSAEFKSSLKKLFEDLLMEFTVKGADCDEFLAQKVKAGNGKTTDTTLRL